MQKVLSRRGRWCHLGSVTGQTWSRSEGHSRQRKGEAVWCEGAARRKASVTRDGKVISGWLGLCREEQACTPSLYASTSECTVAGTVGPAWFSQPIVVIVTFEKDQLHPSGKKRLLEHKSRQTRDLIRLLVNDNPVLFDPPLHPSSFSFLHCELGSCSDLP